MRVCLRLVVCCLLMGCAGSGARRGLVPTTRPIEGPNAAAVETNCLVLASWEFNSFLKAHPEAALELLPIVVKRFRETNEALVNLGAIRNC